MAGERVDRPLAAVLAADIIGYNYLMDGDGEGTLGAFRTLRKSVLAPKIAEHRGRQNHRRESLPAGRTV